MNIYFESSHEVICFCEHLFNDNKKIELNWKTDEDWGNHLQFKENILNEQAIQSIARAMGYVFLEYRLTKEIKSIITEKYYYTNSDEIERILDLSHWIIKGDKHYKEIDLQEDKAVQLLEDLFLTNMKEQRSIHFDSVVTFRLQSFKESLIKYVGMAIDAFKQEEDHQEFVETLRKYIARKEPICDVVYLLQGENFSFFKASGQRFSTLELRSLMYKEPLYIVGLDENEFNLAPLVTLAPKEIQIYGDNPSEPKTVTVLNVFQEKVRFKPAAHFPFTKNINVSKKN